MKPPTELTVGLERDADGRYRVLSPAVGYWADRPPAGAVVGPGSSVGSLARLGQRLRLVLPAGCAGVVEHEAGRRVLGVEFGECLLRLQPLEQAAQSSRDSASGSSAASGEAGTWEVVAPTDGVFYRRPSPDVPAFVEVGSTLSPGQPVGLVEVMKTFNQILYGGAGAPEQAEVQSIRCEDGEEVCAGDVLVVVRRAG